MTKRSYGAQRMIDGLSTMKQCGWKSFMVLGLVVMLVLSAIFTGGMGVQPTSAAPAKICSENDAARQALSWLGGQVLSVNYDSRKGGYWVRVSDRWGRIQDVFVKRGRC